MSTKSTDNDAPKPKSFSGTGLGQIRAATDRDRPPAEECSSADDNTPAAHSPRRLEYQLRAMYGESLFGAWEIGPHVVPIDGLFYRRGKVNSVKRVVTYLLTLTILAVFGVSGFYAVRGFNQKKYDDVARNLITLLRNGSFTSVENTLVQLEPAAQTQWGRERYGGLLARAHATLYRRIDGDSERARQAQHLLNQRASNPNYDARIASALLLPAARATMVQDSFGPGDSLRASNSVDTLRGLVSEAERLRDPAAAHLLALETWYAGNDKEAQKFFQHADRFGPVHQPNLLDIALFYDSLGQTKLASAVVERSIRINASDPWAKLSETLVFEKPKKKVRVLTKVIQAKNNRLPPVLKSRAHLELALALWAAGRHQQSIVQIDMALNTVTGQRPFLLDHFYRCITAGHIAGARHILKHKNWLVRKEPEQNAYRRLRGILRTMGEKPTRKGKVSKRQNSRRRR